LLLGREPYGARNGTLSMVIAMTKGGADGSLHALS
jgi:hypothetical protein